jgi:hypothetical protein
VTVVSTVTVRTVESVVAGIVTGGVTGGIIAVVSRGGVCSFVTGAPPGLGRVPVSLRTRALSARVVC